jgi:hypothetical protein
MDLPDKRFGATLRRAGLRRCACARFFWLDRLRVPAVLRARARFGATFRATFARLVGRGCCARAIGKLAASSTKTRNFVRRFMLPIVHLTLEIYDEKLRQ